MQSSVTNNFLANGIPGEFSRSDNQRARGAMIKSATEANNVPGRVVKTITGNNYDVAVGGNGNFAGILSTPKTAIRPTLDAQAFVTNETQIEVAKSGYLFVTLGAVASVGDFVYYTPATGVILTAAPATTAPAGSERVPGGIVEGLNVTAAGLAEISFDINGDAAKTA